MKVKLAVGLGLAIAAGIAVIWTVNDIRAVSYYAPDIRSGQTRFVVENSPTTPGAQNMTVPIYFAVKPTGNIIIDVSHIRQGGTSPRGVSLNGSRTFYRWSPGAFVVSPSSFSFDATYGLWRSNVSAVLKTTKIDWNDNFNANNWVHFRLTLRDHSGLIGIGGAGTNINLAHQNFMNFSPAGSYNIPLATPCGITNNTVKTIYLNDLDHRNGDNGGQPITVTFRDETSGVTRSWSGDSSYNMGQNGSFPITHTFQPNHKYMLTISGVVPSNILKLVLPYDNVNYASNCSNYSLDPHVNGATMNKFAEPGLSVTVPSYVTRTGTTKSESVNWELSQLIVDPGVKVPNDSAASNNSAAPSAYLTSSGIDYSKAKSGAQVFTLSQTNLPNHVVTVPDRPVGTKVCFVLSVQPRSHDSPQWRHSQAQCIVIAKKPKTQVWGGDLMVGRALGAASASSSDAMGSISIKDIGGERVFGSWVEYGIFATGNISGVASGSAFAGAGLADAKDSPCLYNTLSFTNRSSVALCSGSGQQFGEYETARTIPDMSARFQVSGATPSISSGGSVNIGSNSLQGLYTASGNFNITGGTIEKGKWIVINAPNSNITITGDISYTSEKLQAITDIPQLVIIAKNISIAANVTRIDAWLIASEGSATDGVINTCSAVGATAPLSVQVCNQALTVNGPVMAKHLLLRRTAGSGTGAATGDPAEVINLRADTYLWSMARAQDTGRAQTVYSTELPPRF